MMAQNLTMIASVTPDPGVDFPEAVELMETGRFDASPL
jgi:threonine dehydrogenase-like Zn-dependent dehydrogenase